MKKLIFLSFIIALPFMSFSQFLWWGKGKKKQKTEKVSKYKKLFKGKDVETHKGFITLHKIDKSKLYFEFPVDLLNKDMVLGSTVSKISNNLHCIVGQKPHAPIHIIWTKDNQKLNIRTVNSLSRTTKHAKDKQISNALKQGNIGAIYQTFDILAYTKDSSKVVVDVTKFFTSDIKEIDPFFPSSASSRLGRRTSVFNKEASSLDQIKAFEDNVCIKSFLTYKNTVKGRAGFYEKNTPFTAQLTRTLMLLPENPMRPRIADPRIGAFYTRVNLYEADKNGMTTKYYARKFRLEAKDEQAHKNGDLVEVKKPIVFYLDNNFPENWKEPLTLGILEWNKAFEKIGFKNAVQVKEFPVTDPEFDADNLKYNCIRYAPTPVANAMGPSWYDPRTGEIINASVYIYHDIVKLINRWRFVQTSQCDKRVRSVNLPKDILEKSLKYVVTHEVGHCLDMMHNMAASAAIPTEKLRDPEFTSKTGTTYSVMDYARYNYVAQPGDEKKGVKMCPPGLGLYDFYFIKWLYKPVYGANTPEEEFAVTRTWIDEKADDKRYRYGKQQLFTRLDPSSLSEDLGDDPVKSSDYGVKNLKYILDHINEWVGEEDYDYSFRKSIYNNIIMQYQRYFINVMTNIGGMYLNESFAGDPRPLYQYVSPEVQRKSQKWVLNQLENFDWLLNHKVLKTLPLQSNFKAVKLKKILETIMVRSYGVLHQYPDLSNENRFTVEEYLQNTHNSVWKKTLKNESLKDWERQRQLDYVNEVIMDSGTVLKDGSKPKNLTRISLNDNVFNEFNELMNTIAIEEYGNAAYQFPQSFALNNQPRERVEGFNFERIQFLNFVSLKYCYFDLLQQTRALLKKAVKQANKSDKAHYALMLNKINRVFEK